jgi:hypothetical protein
MMHALGWGLRLDSHLTPYFGGEHRFMPMTAQRLADNALALPVSVHVGRVDEIDSCVERSMDYPAALVAIDALCTEHPGTEPELRDHETTLSEPPVAHSVHFTVEYASGYAVGWCDLGQ